MWTVGASHPKQEKTGFKQDSSRRSLADLKNWSPSRAQGAKKKFKQDSSRRGLADLNNWNPSRAQPGEKSIQAGFKQEGPSRSEKLEPK